MDKRSYTPVPTRQSESMVFSDQPATASLMKAREFATSYQTYCPPSGVQPCMISLQLRKIPPSFNEERLRSLCPTIHIVSVTVDTNTITGQCTGNGTLMLRSCNPDKDLYTLQYALMNHRIEVSKKEENLGKKDTYAQVSSVNWLDSKLERPKTAERPARDCKLSNLESSETLFGSVGRWGEGWKQTRQPTAVDKQFIAEMQWHNTLNARRLF